MKIFKLFVCLSLILSISLVNSFAAISVSDGSAFVTKAEFAADLNNLSNRMSTLENSLDAKIDSLVSSYLSRNGIWNGEDQEKVSKTNEYVNISADGSVWGRRDYEGPFSYNYPLQKLFNESTKSGMFFFEGEWGSGTYFNTNGDVVENNGYLRIEKHGYRSAEFFGVDIQIGIVPKDKSPSVSNFIMKSSFSLSSQYRGYYQSSANVIEHRKFAIGGQVHYGTSCFFVDKGDTVYMLVKAYGNKRMTTAAWPDEVGTGGYVGVKKYKGKVY